MIGRLPGDCKLDRVLPKPLLLKALAGKIPEAVYRRKKQGFTFPWEKWLHRQLLVLATDALGDDRTYRGMGMDPHRIRYLWDRFLSGQPEVTWSRIWSLIVLREWALRHGAYLEENPPAGDAPTLAGVRVP